MPHLCQVDVSYFLIFCRKLYDSYVQMSVEYWNVTQAVCDHCVCQGMPLRNYFDIERKKR